MPVSTAEAPTNHRGGREPAKHEPSPYGYAVYGMERSRDHAQSLLEGGLQWRDTPRAVAEAAGVVFTSVPDDAALEEVASGRDGILAGLGAAKTWADGSTVSPRVSKELAGRARAQAASMLEQIAGGDR